MTEAWTKWESLVVNGIFPLRRFLNRSNHSVVFLTEHQDQPPSGVAIKLVPADPVLAEVQLSYWKTITALSHPHLLRIFDSGRCQLGGHPFLFVVMERADQTLAQLLSHRALTVHETREMLVPTLNALAYLHERKLVQGQLKPPNFLVVNDQLKLASDNARPLSESRASVGKASLYDPPEAKEGRLTAAGDVWALGMTMVEALTQRKPEWSNEQPKKLSLPATLPSQFEHTVRQCLSGNSGDRPTVADLEAQINRAPIASTDSSSEVPTEGESGLAIAVQQPFRKRLLALAIVVAILIALAAILTHLHPSQGGAGSSRSVPTIPKTSMRPATSPIAAAVAENSQTTLSDTQVSEPTTPAVLHQEIPEVSRSARESINGHINVAIRVTVDHSGNVVDEALENPSSSKYFAGLASQAARKWQFAATDNQESREWMLRFEFTREGTTGYITAP